MVTAAPTYAGFKRLIGDESNPTHGIVVDDTSRAMHFIRASQVGTDWARAADTNPTQYWHSNTNPATEYGLMRHNATNLEIESVGGGILLTPVTDVLIADGAGLIIGHTAGVAAGGATGEIQMVGSNSNDTRMVLISYQTANTLAAAPGISLVKSTTATLGGVTDALVADNEVLGFLSVFGSDAVDLDTESGVLQFEVDDASPAAGDIGTACLISLMPGGAGSLTERFRISAAGAVNLPNAGTLVVGNTVIVSGLGSGGTFQVLGTGGDDSQIGLGRWSANSGGPSIALAKSRNATIGSFTILVDNDEIGLIRGYVDDGTDMAHESVRITMEVDDGSPAANDVGGALAILTHAGGGGAITEVFRLTASGQLTLDELAVSNVTARGSGMFPGGIAFTDVANAHIDDGSQGSGTVTHYIGNQAITTSSDMRLKTEIEDWGGSALSLLNQARLVGYEWDDPSDRNPWGKNSRGRYVGMLAQETIRWAPWAINAGNGRDCWLCQTGEPCEEHPYWFADYDHLVPLVIGGVQELDTRLTAVEADEWLRGRVKDAIQDPEFKDWLKAELV